MIKDVKTEDKNIIEYSCRIYIFSLSLLLERSKWINGQIIAADAGRMLGKNRYVSFDILNKLNGNRTLITGA